MPTYTLRDNDKPEEETWDVFMSYSKLEVLLKENPSWQQSITQGHGFIAGTRDIISLQSDGFRDLKRHMHKHAGRQSKINI